MLQGTKVVVCDTKLEKGATAKRTNVTFVLDGCTEEHLLSLAIRAAVVLLQNRWRNQEVIPATFSIALSAVGTGGRAEMTNAEAESVIMTKAMSDPAYLAMIEAKIASMKAQS